MRVHNDRGAFLAAVKVDDATRPGLAFTYKAYWARLSPGRHNVNAVTAVRDTDLGGGPTFHDTRVEVEGVPAELLETPPPEVEELVAGESDRPARGPPPYPASARLTASETVRPSARPATRGVSSFMTAPISRGVVAPASLTASATMRSSSAGSSAAGM